MTGHARHVCFRPNSEVSRLHGLSVAGAKKQAERYSCDAVLVFEDDAKASFTALESFDSVQNSASSAQCRARSRCSATRRGTGKGTLVGSSASGAPAG